MDPQKIKEQIINDLSDQIPELIDGENDFLLNRLTSKKNIVFELIFKKKPENFPKVVILKLFRTEFTEIEYNALKKLEKQNLTVPKVLFFKKPYILMEKVNGINLTNYINNNLKNITSLKEIKHQIRRKIKLGIKNLAKWVALLHKNNLISRNNEHGFIVFNKGDTRLRDFLYNPSTNIIYGMDFEESYEGNFHDDLAWICCSLLDTDPGIFEMDEPRHKIELIKVFLKKYFKVNSDFPFSFEYFADRLIENINIVIERRDLEFGQVRKEMILKKITGIL
ncbi:MAG: hypothetical protein ACFFBP_22300 [Promethearchaeota archaeon]